jgi:integrase
MASIQPLGADGNALPRVDPATGRRLLRNERGGRYEGKPVRWRVWWRDSKGRTASKVFPTKRDAQWHVKEIARQETTGELTDRKAGRKTLEAVYDDVHATRRYASATVALHKALWANPGGGISRTLGSRAIASITPEQIDEFLATINAPSIRDKSRKLLSVLFEFAIDRRWLTSNPARRRRKAATRQERLAANGNNSPEKRYLTDAEVDRLIEAMPDRYKVLTLLMCRQGLRPGEALALRVAKFDPMRRRLVIDTSTTGFTKTGESRELVLPRYVADAVVEHMASFSDPRNPEAWVFPAPAGGMVDLNNWRQRFFDKAVEAAGIEGNITPNSCRHTAASYAFRHGATVLEVQRMLGHAKPSITLDTYSHLMDDSLERLAERLDAAQEGQSA